MANQQTLLGWNRTPQSITFDALGFTPLSAASVGAGVVSSTIQNQKMFPTLYKIRKVAVSYTATDDVSGLNSFNLVVGTGAYQTAGVNASQTATAAGTWAQNDTATTVINGHSVVATVTQATPTVTNVAADIVAAINGASSVNTLVYATNAAGVVTIYAIAPGTAGNAITLTVSKSSTSGTYTAGGSTLAGGVAESGVLIAPNDNSFSSGTQLPTSSTTNGAGVAVAAAGVGYPTNVAVANMAIFSADIPLEAGYPAGAYQAATGQTLTYAPGWISVTTSGGYGIFVPPNYDTVYPMLLPLTLRATTGTVGGSITNLTCEIGYEAVTPLANPGSLAFVQPGIDF
jgi:hypothetical protein